MVAERKIRPLVTTALFLEYESVLLRPEQIEVHGFSPLDVHVLLGEFAALSEAVEVHFLWRPILSDPLDEMVLEAAVNGRADALVTHNIKDFSAAHGLFGVSVMKPVAFLHEVGK
jgi:predicted nucleic acid-binding protein